MFNIIDGDCIHMVRFAVYAAHSVNGVARIHTEILKDSVLKDWYGIYPERFFNETNGITQRRWLVLSNPQLSYMIASKLAAGLSQILMILKSLCSIRMIKR